MKEKTTKSQKIRKKYLYSTYSELGIFKKTCIQIYKKYTCAYIFM